MLSLCPKTVFRWTLWIIGALVCANLGTVYMALEQGHPRLYGLSKLVNLDREENLPTMLSMVQLVGASMIAWKLGTREPNQSLRRLWRFLALGLLWIGVDEALSFHEHLSSVPIGSWRQVSYFHYAWVVPAFFVVAVCGGIMLKLLLALPRPTARMFALSGVIFVGGAVGAEMFGGHYARLLGRLNWSYTICYTIEETLEMLGPALFIRTALRYAQGPHGGRAQAEVAIPQVAPRPSGALPS